MALARQPGLFGWEEPKIDVRFSRERRVALDATAWVEHVPQWVEGHEALFERIERHVEWQTESREMYERVVATPRLLGTWKEEDRSIPVIVQMRVAIRMRYGREVGWPTLALYRGGDDSVAWHRDRPLRDRRESIVAVVSLGGARRFLVRPLGGGASRTFEIRGGDLIVMGGTAQRSFEHSVPKMAHAEPRIAIMFRWASPSGVSPDVSG
jgi:alkylated DNA repair dioxygenase AlkB